MMTLEGLVAKTLRELTKQEEVIEIYEFRYLARSSIHGPAIVIRLTAFYEFGPDPKGVDDA